MAPERNYKRYRQRLVESDPPAVPFLGLLLSDLTFLEEGNPDLLDDKINWMKRRTLASILGCLRTFRKVHYCLEPVPLIMQMLLEIPADLSEKELYDMSLSREERGKADHRSDYQKKNNISFLKENMLNSMESKMKFLTTKRAKKSCSTASPHIQHS